MINNCLRYFQIAEANLKDAETELTRFDALPTEAHSDEEIISKINISKKAFDFTVVSEVFS